MYFSEGLMLAKVEKQHNGDTGTPRKYERRSSSVDTFAYEYRRGVHRREPKRKEIGRSEGEETMPLCANAPALGRYVDSVVRKR